MDSTELEELGERMRVLRKRQGWSQEEIAQKLRVSRVTYAQWEQGRNQIPVLELIRVANLFRVGASYFVDIHVSEIDPQSEMYLRGMPPTLIPAARDYLKKLYEINDASERTIGKKADDTPED